MMILRKHNWKVGQREEAEIVMTLDVVEEISYTLSAGDALRLASELEQIAKWIVKKQQEQVDAYDKAKGAPGKER